MTTWKDLKVGDKIAATTSRRPWEVVSVTRVGNKYLYVNEKKELHKERT